ncbi:MAG: hypothetical protein AAB309_07210 [Deltaproteobacteria bacterium]
MKSDIQKKVKKNSAVIPRYARDDGGQTATEFLFILVAIVFIILFHTQLSLSHIVTSFFRYTSFMSARAEAVNPGGGDVYIQALVGTPTESRLRPAATLLPPQGDGFVRRGDTNDITVDYEVLTYIPFTGGLSEALFQRTSRSPFVAEPPRQEEGEFFDNE